MNARHLTLSLALLLPACSGVGVRDSDGKTPLYLAAERGDLSEVRRLVENGANLDSWNVYPERTSILLKWLPGRRFTAGDRPLHVASEKGHTDVVKYLLVNGADVNAPNREKQTALWKAAASQSDLATAELLAESGAEMDSVDSRGVSPLLVASQKGHVEMVRFLLSKGALVERRTHEGRTALHHAAENGHAAVVEVLLENGAQPNLPMSDGRTALQAAVLAGHQAIVAMLLEKGADPDAHAEGTSPLLVIAAFNGELETVRLLAEHGAKVDKTSEGWTALHHAVANKHVEMIPILVECGADTERAEPENGQTPLQKAIENKQVDMVRALLENGADPDTTVAPRSPPIAQAARLGQLEIVKLLVLHGADINVRDGTWTPLRFAEMGGHQDVAEYLIELGGEK